jgi:hypothetical protein
LAAYRQPGRAPLLIDFPSKSCANKLCPNKKAGGNPAGLLSQKRKAFVAFSSEVAAGLREENASTKDQSRF